jgi:quercetin dioxygenase-like cupin family protein
MADYTVKRFDEMEQAFGGVFRRARAELGVTSFGMNVVSLEEGGFYPNHDHEHDGQEEVYVVLDGSAEFDIEGEKIDLEKGMAVRVAPDTKRHIAPGADGIRMLALGGVPGGLYKAPEFTELGGPEPVPPKATQAV